MLGNLGLHIIKFPSGKFGFVGSIPTILAEEIPATTAAVLGCRTHRNAVGDLVEWRFPVFETDAAALAFAKSKGCDVSEG